MEALTNLQWKDGFYGGKKRSLDQTAEKIRSEARGEEKSPQRPEMISPTLHIRHSPMIIGT